MSFNDKMNFSLGDSPCALGIVLGICLHLNSLLLQVEDPPPLHLEFSFSQCHSLGKIPFQELEGVMVTKLVLSANALDDGGCAILALGLRDFGHIKHLDLSNNPLLTWRSCAALGELLSTRVQVCPELHSLYGCCSITHIPQSKLAV